MEMKFLKMAIVVFAYFISPFIWYCFDDFLATITGIEMLADIPYWTMVSMLWFFYVVVSYPIFSGVYTAITIAFKEDDDE